MCIRDSFIGAAGGGFWAQLMQKVPHVAVQPGAYALVGMACVFTAVFQAPVTGMIMVFEMTQDYGMLPLVMCCCAVSYTHLDVYKRQALLGRHVLKRGKS